jgi:oligoribonuclease (3'-5' exoribonuclease)
MPTPNIELKKIKEREKKIEKKIKESLKDKSHYEKELLKLKKKETKLK